MELKKNEPGTITTGHHISYWLDTMEPIRFEPLKKDLKTDVIVVGGGIAGISIAYCLMQSGKKVVVIDDGDIGSGETGRTTAHLVTALDDRYCELERIYGEEKTKLIAESNKVAIDMIERAVRYEEIDCDFKRVDGYLFAHPTAKPDLLTKELQAAQKAGVEVVELPVMPGFEEPTRCLKFYNQAVFHPLKYLKGMCNALIERGEQIYTGTHAERIDETGIITSDGFKVEAEHVVVATNSPVNNKVVMHLKQYPYRTYVIGAKIKKGSLPDALWWDTGDEAVNSRIPPYHFVRTCPFDKEFDLLLCGGEDHPTGLVTDKTINEEDRYSLLEFWLRENFDAGEIVYQWSGQIMEPMDSIAYIGRNPLDKKNVYIATGDSGNGMTHGTIAGIIIADLINGRENAWEKIYDPSRFQFIKSGKTFFNELVGSFLSYLRNKPSHVSAIELADIPVDEGRIMELEGKKVGAYRDVTNTLHIVSAECTHLKCTIKWNNDEKTWDCPCHGSRYAIDGTPLNGPANKNLEYHVEPAVSGAKEK